MEIFDILVLGGGHAGLEAACISAQMGLKVGLISMPGVQLGSAPCNPSVGGVGKGQVVREIDALGGVMGKLTDLAGIQYRTLNTSKGYAVRSTRVQIDKDLYPQAAQKLVGSYTNITWIQKKVLKVEQGKNNIFHFQTEDKNIYSGKKAIITAGTFLGGKCHTGEHQIEAGRFSCEPSPPLSTLFSQVETLPVRFKTGTPPRLKKNSISYEKLKEQPSDPQVRNFHALHSPFERCTSQVSCYLAYTNEKTLEVIRENKERSPMYNGQIQAVGARYCPSIEDKAFRYPDRNIHHIFIEPEGLNRQTMYPSGISTSLPEDVQKKFVQSIEGLEKSEIAVYGYAVEYDVVNTAKLDSTLQYQDIPGLYFAGQVNGTSGYEEAAGQGLVAGINAALSVQKKAPMILDRYESYIGVMIEDLISNQRDEPYRLFSARAENRLHLREDNALLRMAPYRKQLGLNMELDQHIEKHRNEVLLLEEILQQKAQPLFLERFLSESCGPIGPEDTVSEIIVKNGGMEHSFLSKVLSYNGIIAMSQSVETSIISTIYDGYLQRSIEQNSKVRKLEDKGINWKELVESKSISFECRQRIAKIQPRTFGQLKSIQGIRPATLVLVASKAS